jgi:RNA polymerase sigma-70 factor, ECF subfamily
VATDTGPRELVRDSATFAQLVKKARDPSASLHEQHEAFAQLVRQSQHIVFGLALVSLRDVEDAKDAAQDAFATAWHRLRQLRDPSAFASWLRAIVATACSRQLRKRALVPGDPSLEPAVEADDRQMDYQAVVASALERLPDGERDVTVLFYYLGYTQPQIAKLLRLKPGTVGKRLHSARLRIRRGLPRSVRGDFVRLGPSKQFLERVSRGLLDEYVGEYRFERRPDLVVRITREGDSLVSEGGGQRHVLFTLGKHSLLTINYDGEARFRRNRRGMVTDFVYYEFGRRLGIARKVDSIGRTA